MRALSGRLEELVMTKEVEEAEAHASNREHGMIIHCEILVGSNTLTPRDESCVRPPRDFKSLNRAAHT